MFLSFETSAPRLCRRLCYTNVHSLSLLSVEIRHVLRNLPRTRSEPRVSTSATSPGQGQVIQVRIKAKTLSPAFPPTWAGLAMILMIQESYFSSMAWACHTIFVPSNRPIICFESFRVVHSLCIVSTKIFEAPLAVSCARLCKSLWRSFLGGRKFPQISLRFPSPFHSIYSILNDPDFSKYEQCHQPSQGPSAKFLLFLQEPLHGITSAGNATPKSWHRTKIANQDVEDKKAKVAGKRRKWTKNDTM